MNTQDEILERLAQLETKALFQDETIHELSTEIWKLHQELDRLEKQNKILNTKLKDLAESGGLGPGPANQKPPHY